MSLTIALVCWSRETMLSLAKKKEFAAQSKPEFLPDEKLRPWVANPAAQEQIHTLVEDLEKMLALGSPVKEEHGASEIDRQIGTVDDDLLVDDEEPEPVDFQLPSQAFQSFLRRQERAKAGPVDEDVPLNEDADVCQLLKELNSYEEAGEGEGEEEGGDSGRGQAWAESLPPPLCTSRPLTHRRLVAMKKERMKAKEEVRAKLLRPPQTRALPFSARVHFARAQQRKLGAEGRQAPRRKRAAEGAHIGAKGREAANEAVPRREVKPFPDKAAGANLRSGHVSALEKRMSTRQPSVATHRALDCPAAAVGVGQAGHTPQPPQSDHATPQGRGMLSAPSSARRVMVGDMLRPPSAPPGPALSSADLRSHAAACPSPLLSLDRPLLPSHRPSTAPSNGRDTVHQNQHHGHTPPHRSSHSNQDGNSGRRPLPRPYANTSFAPRCLSSSRNSARPSSAATDGTIEVYDFAYRPWSPPSLTGNMARRPPSAPPEEGDTYKRRAEALRSELVRYELSVLKTVDPRDLRNEMKAKGRLDNVWKVFTDPTITKQDLKGLMVSHNNTEHSFNEHFERELRLAKSLCPEYAMKQSKEARWAENALANRINVFESGTWPKKPAR